MGQKSVSDPSVAQIRSDPSPTTFRGSRGDHHYSAILLQMLPFIHPCPFIIDKRLMGLIEDVQMPSQCRRFLNFKYYFSFSVQVKIFKNTTIRLVFSDLILSFYNLNLVG